MPAPGQPFTRHQLLSSNFTLQSQSPSLNPTQTTQIVQGQGQGQGKTQNQGADNLFSLDFHAPATTTQPTQPVSSEAVKKDPKQDILSLFSYPTPVHMPTSAWQGASAFPQQQYQQAGAGVAQAQAQVPKTGMLGTSGTGVWGASSGWQGPTASVAPGTGVGAAGFGAGGVPALPAQPNIWGSPANSMGMGMGLGVGPSAGNGLVDTASIWGGGPAPAPALGSGAFGMGTGTGLGAGATPAGFGTQTNLKKDDAFGDIWSGFR